MGPTRRASFSGPAGQNPLLLHPIEVTHWRGAPVGDSVDRNPSRGSLGGDPLEGPPL